MKLLVLIILISTVSYSHENDWGVKIEKGDKSAKIGGRIQAVAENNDDNQNLYLRRLRLNFVFGLSKGQKIVYDVRNDNVNKESEEEFVIGDAYWEIKEGDTKFRFFRAKVDMSYSQTSSSKHLFSPDRSFVSDYASDFVVQNRRATNAQVNSKIGGLNYQVVLSNGVQAQDLKDNDERSVDDLIAQKLTYGLRLRYFFFGNGKVQDTFYGEHDTFSIGASHFRNDRIEVANSNSSLNNIIFQRSISNLDVSFAYKNLRLLGEFFYFENDICDLSETSKNSLLCVSRGHYAQAEYIVNKYAPYVKYETFRRGAVDLKAKTVGMNYYKNLDSKRFGAHYQVITSESEDQEKISFYCMLNF